MKFLYKNFLFRSDVKSLLRTHKPAILIDLPIGAMAGAVAAANGDSGSEIAMEGAMSQERTGQSAA